MPLRLRASQPRETYLVRARNKYGTTTAELTLRVLDPLAIDEFTDASPVYVAGKPIPPNLPSGAKHSFEKVWFSIAPPLPRGLSMPMNTGIICGTPIVPCKPTKYTVNAESRFSSATADVTITIVDKKREDELKANEELDVISIIQTAPAKGKVHISYTGPLPKGKEWMALGRLVVGVGSGVATTVVPAYLVEISPRDKRGFMVRGAPSGAPRLRASRGDG